MKEVPKELIELSDLFDARHDVMVANRGVSFDDNDYGIICLRTKSHDVNGYLILADLAREINEILGDDIQVELRLVWYGSSAPFLAMEAWVRDVSDIMSKLSEYGVLRSNTVRKLV